MCVYIYIENKYIYIYMDKWVSNSLSDISDRIRLVTNSHVSAYKGEQHNHSETFSHGLPIFIIIFRVKMALDTDPYLYLRA